MKSWLKIKSLELEDSSWNLVQFFGLKRYNSLLHFVAFFHVASLFSTGLDNEKVGLDNEKALELTNALFSIEVDNEKALELDNRIFFSYFSLISM